MYAIDTAKGSLLMIATVREIAERWLQEVLGVFSQDTVSLYRWHLDNHVLPEFGGRTQISREDALGFRERKKAAGLSDSMIHTSLRLLRRLLEFGAESGMCDPPGWKLDLPKPARAKAASILPEEDCRRLASFLEDNPAPMHLCIYLILRLGLNAAEVLEAKWEDVSLDDRTIRVKLSRGPVSSRENQSRMLPFSEAELPYLRKMAGSPGDFLCSGSPRPRRRPALENRWRLVQDELLLPPTTLTELRQSYGVRCLNEGMSYQALSEKLGITNSAFFRNSYVALVSEERRAVLELEDRQSRTQLEARSVWGPKTRTALMQEAVEEKKKELQQLLDSLDADLQIIKTLRNSDCVQGACRRGLYNFIEKVLGDDKDGKYLVEYLRCNMRVAEMPLLKVTTAQAIRHRVTHGFEKLNARLDDICAVEGWDIMKLFRELCAAVEAAAPARRGPKPGEDAGAMFRSAMDSVARLQERILELEEYEKSRHQ